MMLYEFDTTELSSLGPPVGCPSLVTLRLRKKDEPLTPWYSRQIAENHLLREESKGPGICASCGIGTWMELYGTSTCHECADRLRFAGYPLGFREAVKKGVPCQTS